MVQWAAKMGTSQPAEPEMATPSPRTWGHGESSQQRTEDTCDSGSNHPAPPALLPLAPGHRCLCPTALHVWIPHSSQER